MAKGVEGYKRGMPPLEDAASVASILGSSTPLERHFWCAGCIHVEIHRY